MPFLLAGVSGLVSISAIYEQRGLNFFPSRNYTVEPSVEAIDQALEDYLEVNEDNDTWYSFHEFIEDREG